ncbi:isoprenylcysteine carboxylmethyltransferase family protein [Hyphomicrobiales bacterium]|nr:isoprenylcysteine carboxylmethyltransferase family protein [Hyphomicrobiales bacterium]
MKTKIPPPLVALIVMLLTFLSRDYLDIFYLHPHLQRTLFLLFLVIGVSVIFLATRQFKISKTTVNPLKPETASSLVTSGIFRRTRNPMYLGLTSLLISFSIYFSSVFGIIIYLPLFISYITIFQIIPEEDAMNKLFSNDYKSYCLKVRRWI